MLQQNDRMKKYLDSASDKSENGQSWFVGGNQSSYFGYSSQMLTIE